MSAGGQLEKGMKKLSKAMELSYISVALLSTWCIHLSKLIEMYVHFIVHKLHLNKFILKTFGSHWSTGYGGNNH